MNPKLAFTALRRLTQWASECLPLLLLAVLLASSAPARDGQNDPTFNTSDNGTTGTGADGFVYAVVVRPDGSIVLAGTFRSLNGNVRTRIAVMQPDGSTGPVFAASVNEAVRAMVAQPDGSLILGGEFSAVQNSQRVRIARITPAGTLDPAYFGSGAGANSTVHAMVLQPDGRVVIGGHFSQVHGVNRFRVARLTTTGAVDPSFVSTIGAQGGGVYALALQPDGKIVIGGTFTSYDNVPRMGCARLNADGSLDTSFQPGAGIGGAGTLQVQSLAIASDGKIWVGGQFTTFDGVPRVRIARLNTDGSLDTSTDPSMSVDDIPYSMHMRADGKLLLAGDFNQVNGVVSEGTGRMNSDGSVDTSYVPAADGGNVRALVPQPDGRLVVGGGFSVYGSVGRGGIVRLEPDGALDTTFNVNRGADDDVTCSIRLSSGGYVLGGLFRSYNAVPVASLVRLLPDGTPDPAFNQGSGLAHSSIHPWIMSLAEQPDGRLMIGGVFHTYDGIARDSLARLHPDGSLDTSFDTGVDIFGFIYAIAVQSDGKIIVGGTFEDIAGIPRGKIARFHPDGSLDLGFATGAGIIGVSSSASVRGIALQPDGKVLIVGEFNNFDGVLQRGVARLDAQGNLDPSFNPGPGVLGTAGSIVHQADGKTVIGGLFSSVAGVSISCVARLMPDGSVDPTFQPGTGTNNAVSALVQQPDGKYLIAGRFTTFNGIGRPGLARLHANGALDTSFVVGAGATPQVNTLALTDDGRALIAGEFTSYSGVPRHRVARVVAYTPQPTTYCTAGTSAQGCTPTITGTGLPRLSLSTGFTLTVQGLPGQRQGLIFYGINGRLGAPWGQGSTSFRCVEAPTQRLPVQSSGGNVGACDGSFAQDWRAWIASRPSALGQPLFAGELFDAQAWYRDPIAPKGTNLTNAVEFVIAP